MNYCKGLTSLLMIVFLALAAVKSQARARITVGEIEVLKKVADLPDVEEYKIENGQYADIGVLYQVYKIAFIPLWVTKEPVLVASDPKEDTYLEIPDAEMDGILRKNNLQRDKLLNIGFYTRYGGKLVSLLLLAIIIYGIIPSKKRKRNVLPDRV